MGLRHSTTKVVVLAADLDPVGATPDGLILGHPTRGKIGAAANNKLRPSGTVTDLSCFVTRISISRGRRTILEAPDPGRCVVSFESTDRRFDPLSTTGAYSGGVGRNRFRRMLPMMVAVTNLNKDNPPSGPATVDGRNYPLFAGWVDNVDYTYDPTGSLFRAEVTLIDAFGLLASVDLNAAERVYGGGDTLSARMERWAEVANIGGGVAGTDGLVASTTFLSFPQQRYGLREMSDAQFELQSTNFSANALTAVKQTAASSDAWVWAASDGPLSWRAIPTPVTGLQRPIAPPGAGITTSWFTDDPGSTTTDVIMRSDTMSWTLSPNKAFVSNPNPKLDPQSWANVIKMSRAGGTEQTKVAEQVDTDGRVEFNRSDLLNNNDGDVATIAQRLVDRHGSRPPIVVSFDVEPWLSDAALYAALINDLGDMVTWEWTQVGLDVRGPILAISHEISPGVDWRMSVTVCEWLQWGLAGVSGTGRVLAPTVTIN
jgi:hypothetical protein